MGTLTEVGETVNEINPFSVVITDRDGNDVTDQYDISAIYGTLTVIDPEE